MSLREIEKDDWVYLDYCPTCGHLACICDIKAKHNEECLFRRAATCSIPIECEHGYDVCPKCDPCTCKEIEKC